MSSERLAILSQTMQAQVESGRIPGAVIAIARRNKVVYLEALGYRDRAAGVPMTTDSLFWAASMTKPMTAAGALRLYEQGKLLLNDPIGKYLPQFGNMQVAHVVTDANGWTIVETVPAIRQPTILDLMRHTSGIVEGLLGSTPVHKMYADAVGDGMTALTGSEFIDRLSRLPLLHQPGAVWHYGWGMDLLGLIVEQITGQPLRTYLQTCLFDPLEMQETGFGVPAEKQAQYVRAFAVDPFSGQPQKLPDLSIARFDSGGAGVVTTAGDYLRFALMLLNKGKWGDQRLLGRKTVDYMTANQLGPEVDASRIGMTDPLLTGYGFGLGLAVRRTAGIAPAPGSIGDFSWSGAGGTCWWADPQEELAVVFMAHTPSRAASRYYSQLMRALVMQAIVD